MTTRLLRIFIVLIVGTFIVAVTSAVLMGSRTALAIAILVVTLHAIVLALEFALMWAINRTEDIPRPTSLQVLSAWAHECVSAVRVFCWIQPFRTSTCPDTAGAACKGRRGVVLIHGFACNRAIWNRWLKRLQMLGAPVIAVNLDPPWASIENYASTIEQAVTTLERNTGCAPVLVAHSMGGLAVRFWWSRAGNSGRIHHLITLGTPHQGTWLAKLGLSLNVREMRRGSPWLLKLGQCEAERAHASMTCYFSHCDNVVFPATTATLAGADNRHLAASAHVQMVDREEPWLELLNRLKD